MQKQYFILPDRRGFLKLLAAFFSAPALMAQEHKPGNTEFKQALADFSNGKPIFVNETVFKMELESSIDNGYSVPIALSANAVTTDKVVEMAIFSAVNPFAEIARFEFPKNSLKTEVKTRIRLAGDQTLYAMAKTQQGKIYQATKSVKVAIGGCSV